jgi:hypothetical protein
MVSKIDRQAFLQSLIVPPGKEISLHKDYDPGFKPDYITKEDATLLLEQGIEKMAVLRFILCNGRGYKRLNPYRERHLAIFVNCF